jgi:hypothetical protein
VISVLTRAYRLTSEPAFLDTARRALRPFELDIRDGGVCSSPGGVFFEEVAVYPAAHILNGYILALFGLYDYVALTSSPVVAALIEGSLRTLHELIDDYDAGYWSYYDLRFKHLAPPFYHALHVTLLEALARLSGCEHCQLLAFKWDGYRLSPRLLRHYRMMRWLRRCRYGLGRLTSRNGASYSS